MEESSDPATGEGFLHLLPVPLKEGMEVEGIVMAPLPWGVPGLLGMVGKDPHGEPRLIISYEWPIPWARVTTPLEQQLLEWLQLERFRTDHLFGTQSLPFTEAGLGLDPPDFLARTSQGLEGVECTSFAVPERREALALFTRVRGGLVERPGPGLLHLDGFMLYMWFGGPESSERHFRRTDDEAVVRGHDKPGVDWVLISTGNPNEWGQVFPSDEAVARFAIEHPLTLGSPEHVKRVTLHFWSTGEAWDLYPRFARLFGPLYQGSSAPYQPLVAQPEHEPESERSSS